MNTPGFWLTHHFRRNVFAAFFEIVIVFFCLDWAVAEDFSKLQVIELPLKVQDSNATLAVRIAAESRCFFGDLDVLALDLALSKNPRLLLSLEPIFLSDTSFEPRSTEWHNPKSLHDIIRGAGFYTSLSFLKLESPKLLGLYICTDSNNTGRCLGKPEVEFDEILQRHEVGRNVPKDIVIPDKIYFFRYLVITPQFARIFEAPMSEIRYELLERYLEPIIPGKATRTNAISVIRRFNARIGSLPLKVEEEPVRISLPWFDRKNCFAKQKTTP